MITYDFWKWKVWRVWPDIFNQFLAFVHARDSDLILFCSLACHSCSRCFVKAQFMFFFVFRDFFHTFLEFFNYLNTFVIYGMSRIPAVWRKIMNEGLKLSDLIVYTQLLWRLESYFFRFQSSGFLALSFSIYEFQIRYVFLNQIEIKSGKSVESTTLISMKTNSRPT